MSLEWNGVGMEEGCFYEKKGCTFGKILRRRIIFFGGSCCRWRWTLIEKKYQKVN